MQSVVRPSRRAIAAGLMLGAIVDQMWGDPRRFHPVAGFGQVAGALQRYLYRDSKLAGAAFHGALVGAVSGAGLIAQRRAASSISATTVLTALATWTVLGGRSLTREASAVAALALEADLGAARARIRNLVGRDPSQLSRDELARATVESVAENTSDAVIAPLMWGAIGGMPGLLAYRAINTLDAMVGYRSLKYANFGWFSARVDDVANYLPARLGAGITAAVAPLVGGSPKAVLRLVHRDAAKHPSPNAGHVETAFAAALGIELGGQNAYGGVVENRGTLGDGRPPVLSDIPRAVRLSKLVCATALVLATAAAALPKARRAAD
ncbi:MAG: cobalamin biosynthesis protein [Antricoccus sp.]